MAGMVLVHHDRVGADAGAPWWFCGRKEELRNPGGDLHSWGTAELLGLEKRWDHIRILKYHVLATNSFALCGYQVLLEYTVTASTGCCMGITPHWNTWVSFVITAVLTASAQWVPEPNLLPDIFFDTWPEPIQFWTLKGGCAGISRYFGHSQTWLGISSITSWHFWVVIGGSFKKYPKNDRK